MTGTSRTTAHRDSNLFRITRRRARVATTLALAALMLVLIPAATAVPQDVDADDDFPTTRRARVALMMGANTAGVSTGGYRVLLAFEDDLEPSQFVLWVDQTLWQRTATGDLFIARYKPDGTLIDVIGPVKE